MSRPDVVKLALVLFAVPVLTAPVSAQQDRSSTRMRVQQMPIGSSMSAEAATLARATQMQVQLDQAAKAALTASTPVRSKVTPQQAARLKAIGRELARNPNSAAALRDWQGLIASMRPAAGDINALVQWVLRESYLEQNEDLRHYAEKVKHYNEMKSKLREQLNAGKAGTTVTHTSATSGAATSAGKTTTATAARIQARPITAGDDAQLANVDLQNALQKQQQTMQMMRNISKQLNDTASAVIRKIGG